MDDTSAASPRDAQGPAGSAGAGAALQGGMPGPAQAALQGGEAGQQASLQDVEVELCGGLMAALQALALQGELLQCDYCGKPFARPKSIGRKPKYGRAVCRVRAFEARRLRREVAVAVLQGTVLAPLNSSQTKSPEGLKGAEEVPLF